MYLLLLSLATKNAISFLSLRTKDSMSKSAAKTVKYIVGYNTAGAAGCILR